MIQKISFGSTYRFINRHDLNRYSHALTINALYNSLSSLNEGDKVEIRRGKNDDYELKVPRYLDKSVESYCIYGGIEYTKQ